MMEHSATFRKTGAVLFVAAVWLATAGLAPKHLKAILEGRYAGIKTAMANRDSAAIAAIYVPGFESIDTSNQIETGEQTIEYVMRLKKDPNKHGATTIAIRSHTADIAVVDQKYDMNTRMNGPDGAMHSVRLIALSTDTWVERKSIWLMQRTVTEQLSYFVDGVLTNRIIRPGSRLTP